MEIYSKEWKSREQSAGNNLKRDSIAPVIDLTSGYVIFYRISSINIHVCLNSVKESVSISSVILRNKQQVCHIEIIRKRTGSNTNTGNVLTILIFCLLKRIFLLEYKTQNLSVFLVFFLLFSLSVSIV